MTTPKEYTEKFTEVYLAELDYIKQRREQMGLSSVQITQETERLYQNLDKPLTEGEARSPKTVMPSTNAGLVGLALSGGGIRSATFNLGLLQALAEKKVLQYCDYLSTVSGGGYIGSCVSSLLADTPEASTKPDEFPLRDQREAGEARKEVNHLRATKNYLGLSSGVFNPDNWYFVGLDISAKLLLNTIPLALMILLTLVLYAGERTFYLNLLDSLDNVLPATWIQMKAIPTVSLSTIVWLIAAIAALVVLTTRWAQVSIWFGRGSYESRQRSGSRIARWTIIAVVLSMMAILLNFIYSQAWYWVVKNTDSYFNIMDVVVYLLVVSIVVILGGQLSLYKSSTEQKFVQIIMSAACVVLLVTLPIGLLALVYEVEKDSLIPYLAKQTCQLQLPSTSTAGDEDVKTCVESLTPTLMQLYINADGYLRNVSETLKNTPVKNDLDENLQGKLTTVIDKYRQGETESDRQHLIKEPVRRHLIMVMWVMSAILLLIGVFININDNALHPFYRDRLSKTFLVRRSKENEEEEIKPNYSVLLKDLHQHHNGPYHLVNVTLNVPESKNPLLQGRGADFFMFSKFYCGAESTGYRSTTSYNHGQTQLATAMAISGAAASPEMGTSTNPFLAMAMTLLNVRLHQWMPNPKFDRPPRLTFWPSYLVKELLREGSEQDSRLNLSDGGHHENLGVYPLLKRRCRVIIASDAGADPKFNLTDLTNLQRKARIDLGIEIKFQGRENLSLDQQHQTPRRFLVGTIQYPEKGEVGILLYLKTTMTGTESEDVLAYRRKQPDFPHQSTADQFFDEDQFESYRKLGQLSGKEVFPDEIDDIKGLEKRLGEFL